LWAGELLGASAEQHSQSGQVALDSTFFDRGHVSAYYLTRSDRSVETLKVTTLTDTESLAVLDVQCYAQWRHDTKAGPQVVRRNADDLRAVLADNTFQDWHTEYEYYAMQIHEKAMENILLFIRVVVASILILIQPLANTVTL
jgi:hypothetical protein